MNTVTEQDPPWWMRLIVGRRPRRTLLRLFVLVSLSVVVFRFVLLPIEIKGMSMRPTYTDGKVNFVNRLAYKWSKPKRSDVVAIQIPGEGVLLKRIVGLPGERIALVNGKVYVNAKPLEEPYVRNKGEGAISLATAITLEKAHYFVIGDDRDVTIARQVPGWEILGKVVF